ncbi:MAG TPA: hypothetical protein VFN97_21700 [Actinospica sp.]|nr:hypothetical protein [Actinospica sp.]
MRAQADGSPDPDTEHLLWAATRTVQPEFGARPLRRPLQTELDNRLAVLLLDGTVRPGDTIVADAGEGGELTVRLAGGAKDDE